MSRSEAHARIEVKAPLGTAITLADGGFRTVAQTTTTLEKDFPGGVYLLKPLVYDLAELLLGHSRHRHFLGAPLDGPMASEELNDAVTHADDHYRCVHSLVGERLDRVCK